MTRRIKVVQMICGLVVGDLGGGAELFAIRLAEALDPALFEVTMCNIWRYNLPIEQHWQRQLSERGIKVLYGSHVVQPNMYRDLPCAYAACLPQLAVRRPDILNTHVEFPGLVGAGLRLSGVGRHLVRTCHTLREWPDNPGFRWRTNWINACVPSVEVGVSHAIVEQLNQRPSAKLARTHARYIHNGVDADTLLRQRTGNDIRVELGIPASIPLFGTVGRLMEQKGLPYLIRAIPHVRAALPNAHLVIVGKGPDEPQLRALIAEYALEDCITLLGGRSDAVDIIAGLNVFALASLWEGLPTVVLEAMVLETPVVATNIPGTRDLVIEGETGLLVPTRDPQALAAAMVRQYTEREQAQRMAANARQHVNDFSFQAVAQHYTALYHELMERRWFARS